MSRTHHRLTTIAVLALALAAITAPVAQARYPLNDPVTPKAPPTAAQSSPAGEPAMRIVRASDHGGFDWADAGIGAAGGLPIALVALGLTLVVPQRNQARP